MLITAVAESMSLRKVGITGRSASSDIATALNEPGTDFHQRDVRLVPTKVHARESEESAQPLHT